MILLLVIVYIHYIKYFIGYVVVPGLIIWVSACVFSNVDVIGYITKFSPLQADVNDSSSPGKLDFALENEVLVSI